jgi:sulfotransferase family protein
MKVIGAGLPRTATTTQMFALEHLGFAPCYHMRDLLADLETGLPLWEAVQDGSPDWDAIFDRGATPSKSTVDWPSARFYRELADYYPEAKVLLSVRDADAWVRSMRKTVWGLFHDDSVMRHVSDARTVVDPLWNRYIALMTRMNWDEHTGALSGDHFSDDGLADAMSKWNDGVVASIPAERLLVWDPAEGWEPLCEFLEVDVPSEELPRLNDTQSFIEGITGGALDSVTEWWSERDRPTSGLHGAALA